MFDPMKDARNIRAARSAYNAHKTTSDLILWICSEEWLFDIDEQIEICKDDVRGTVYRDQEYPFDGNNAEEVYSGDTVGGEITC